MSLLFRLANINDTDRILEMYEEAKTEPLCLWNEYYPLKEDIEKDLERDDLFVLEKDGKVIGALSLEKDNEELKDIKVFKVNENTKEPARVVIAKVHQGNGYAAYMMIELEKFYKERGVKASHLLAGVSNPPTFKTYLKCGYEILGTTHLFNDEYYIMEKIL